MVLDTFFKMILRGVFTFVFTSYAPDSWLPSPACSSEVEGALLTRTDWEVCFRLKSSDFIVGVLETGKLHVPG
jgi:hypothetical protein